MTDKHTPLPWKSYDYFCNVDGRRKVGVTPEGLLSDICSVHTNVDISSRGAEESTSNAKLIVDSVNNYPKVKAENAKLREALWLIHLLKSNMFDVPTHAGTIKKLEVATFLLSRSEEISTKALEETA